MQVRSRDGRLSSRSLVLGLTVVAAGRRVRALAAAAGTGEGGSSSASGGHGGTGGTSPEPAAPGSGGSGGRRLRRRRTTGAGGASARAAAAPQPGFGGVTHRSGSAAYRERWRKQPGALGAGGSAGGGGIARQRRRCRGIRGAVASTGTGGSPGSGGAAASGGTQAAAPAERPATAERRPAGATTGRRRNDRQGRRDRRYGGATGTGGRARPAHGGSDRLPRSVRRTPSSAPTSRRRAASRQSPPVGTATFEDPTETGATFDGASGVMLLDTTAPYDGTQSLAGDAVVHRHRPDPGDLGPLDLLGPPLHQERSGHRPDERECVLRGRDQPHVSHGELRRAVGAARLPLPRQERHALPGGSRPAG